MERLTLLNKARLKLLNRVYPFAKPEIQSLGTLQKGTTFISLPKAFAEVEAVGISENVAPAIFSPEITNNFCPEAPKIGRITTDFAVPIHVVKSYLLEPPEITGDLCPRTPDFHGISTAFVASPEIETAHLLGPPDLIGINTEIKTPCVEGFSGELQQEKTDFREFSTSIEQPIIEDLTEILNTLISHPKIETFSLSLEKPRGAGKAYNQYKPIKKQAVLFELQDTNCIHGLKKKFCSTCIKKETPRQIKSSYVDSFDLILPILQPPLGDNFDNVIALPPGQELYPFQRAGVKFLVEHERALLGDEMGLGKSIQTIVAIRVLLRMAEATCGLILCPKAVLTDWEKKLRVWAPELVVTKIHGSKEQREIAWESAAHVYLTTYETLRQDLSASLGADKSDADIAKKHFDFVILDEIQKIKNPGANLTKATRTIEAPIRWGLSGTPLENRLEDVISIFAYIKPRLLRLDDANSPKRVREAIKPYFLRRRKVDALPELPEKVYGEVWLELAPAQRAIYDIAKHKGIVEINDRGDKVTVQHILALITKLKQICNLDPKTKESCKLEYLAEQLEDVSAQGDKALVFSQYPESTLKFLEPNLKQFCPLIYHGTLSSARRDEVVKRFQEEDGNKALLMSTKAGGVGITLTRANYVFHFDMWWNPSVAAQAEDRAHRIGQKKTVFVTSLLTVGTIEEDIQKLLEKKRKLFKDVIDDLSDTNLSNVLTEEELFGLFGLQKPKRTAAKDAVKDKNRDTSAPKKEPAKRKVVKPKAKAKS